MNPAPLDIEAQKRQAAKEAAELVESGMVVGLGTGSTAKFAVEAIARKLKAEKLENILGIPTSTWTRNLAEALGFPLTTLEAHPVVDLTIDGADEVGPAGNLIKGAGGALLREKIVAVASLRLAIVVDEGKLVPRLGAVFPLPVEVVRFGWHTHEAALRDLGAEPVLRQETASVPFETDEGHYILDCRFPEGIEDPHAVDRALQSRPGVVETGLFLDMAPEVFIGWRVKP